MFSKIRKYFLSLLPHPPSPSTTPISSPGPLQPHLPATASPFAAEDYLVAHCGLSRPQARMVSKNLSHLKSPTRLDAAVTFLTGLGLSRTDIATVVTKDPHLLCADVEETLAPRVVKLSNLGLSHPEIGRLVLAAGKQFRGKLFLRKVELERHIFGSLGKPLQVVHLPSKRFVHFLDFWLGISGSLDEPLRIVKVNNGVLSIDLEKAAIPNLTLLQQRGVAVPDSELPDKTVRGLLTKRTDYLIKALACMDEIGIRQSSPVFLRVLLTFTSTSSEMLINNLQLLRKFGWSKNEISLAVSQAPHIVCLREERLRRSLEFLIGDVGLEIPYIAQKPMLILCDTECQLLPRHCLMKFLEYKGLLKFYLSFDFIVKMDEEKFLRRFVHPYEESFPGLASVYASSCAGKHQWEQLYEMDDEQLYEMDEEKKK